MESLASVEEMPAKNDRGRECRRWKANSAVRIYSPMPATARSTRVIRPVSDLRRLLGV